MRLQSYPEKCTGCQICEIFCSFRKEQAIWPAKSRISVLKWEEKATYVPFTCQQCEEAPCKAVCPTRAIYRHPETGALLVDEQRCLGCRMCVMACPFGAMAFDSDRGRPAKCDLCDGDPECARSMRLHTAQKSNTR
jgi:Fe-S-cluster-containing hydrogenase component 2